MKNTIPMRLEALVIPALKSDLTRLMASRAEITSKTRNATAIPMKG